MTAKTTKHREKKTKKSQIQNFNYSKLVPGNERNSSFLFIFMCLRFRWLNVCNKNNNNGTKKYLVVLSNDGTGKRRWQHSTYFRYTHTHKKGIHQQFLIRIWLAKLTSTEKKLLFWRKGHTFVQRVFVICNFTVMPAKQLQEETQNTSIRTYSFCHTCTDECPYIFRVFRFCKLLSYHIVGTFVLLLQYNPFASLLSLSFSFVSLLS